MRWGSLLAGMAVGLGAERLGTRRFQRDEGPPSPTVTWTEHLIDTPDGGVMRYLEAGRGRPVVLLHGVTLHAEIWRAQFELASEARVIAVDLRGHGASVSGSGGASIAANSDDLARLLVDLDVTDAVLVGHSMGGMVVGRCIADHRSIIDERVAGLVFVSTAARNPVDRLSSRVLRTTNPGLQGMAARRPALLRRLLTVPANDLGQVMVRATFGARPTLGAVRATAAAFDAIEVDEFLGAAPSILDHDGVDELRSCELPATVLVGRRDPLTPPREARRLAAALPNAELEVLDRAGHQLMLERPAEVNLALRTLLARTAAPDSATTVRD